MARRNLYPAEVRDRAVRLVCEGESRYESQWAAICSIAARIGCPPELLRTWVREVQGDALPSTMGSDDERSTPGQLATPYNDQYPSCERADVTLQIYPGERDPEWVTTFLGIQPTLLTRRGEQRTNSLGRVHTTPLNAWFLASEGIVESLDARRHVDWLLDELWPVRERVQELVEDDEVNMRVTCVWWSAAGHGGPILSPSQMSGLAELNLELSFDIYFFGDEW